MRAYRDWMIGQALPTWATRGFDAGTGLFRERLDAGGAPIDVPHRAMVQARQIYVYARAALMGWHAEGGVLAERAMAQLQADFAQEAGDRLSMAFSIRPGGGVVSAERDSYTHAFLLFATAWLYRLTGDAALLAMADRLTRFIEAELIDPLHGGVFDTAPPALRDKRQNPLMHLLEAYLAMERAAPGRGYLERAGGLVALFKARLFAPAQGLLLEHFDADWADHSDAARAGVYEPGHHFEWVWLLGEYQALSGEDVSTFGDALYDSARRAGLSARGLILDELRADGTVTKSGNRVWPHTEAIKAATTRHAAGDPAAAGFAGQMAGALLDTFLDRPFAGGWIDHRAADGQALVDYVPASSLYHLFFAAVEAEALIAPAADRAQA